MRAHGVIGGRTIVAGLLLGVSACTTPQTTDRVGAEPAAAPSVAEQQPDDAALNTSLQDLISSEAAGRTGTMKGLGVLIITPAPPILLAKGSFSLVPFTSDLEAKLRDIGRSWRQQQRHPVSVSEYQAAFDLLNRHVLAVRALNGQAFIREAESDDKGRFTFERVPEGRWLLVTDMVSPVSALLWAIPGQVIAGQTTFVRVGNENILIEGRRSETKEEIRP